MTAGRDAAKVLRLHDIDECRDDLAIALRDAADPLSRIHLSHSAACPLMHGGTCACGVAAIERLAALAKRASDG